MVVVLDCRGGSSMGLTRHMGLLKRLAITLNEHYPVRQPRPQLAALLLTPQSGVAVFRLAPAGRKADGLLSGVPTLGLG